MDDKGFGSILITLAKQVPAIIEFVGFLAGIIGLWFVAKMILMLVKISSGKNGGAEAVSPGQVIVTGLVGGLLIGFNQYVPTVVSTMSGGSFEYGSMLSYAEQAATPFGDFAPVVGALFSIMQALGLVAMLHGTILLTQINSGGQDKSVLGRTLIHICVGGLVVDIGGTIKMLADTSGLDNYLN